MSRTVTTNTAGNEFLTRVYNCKNNADLVALYDDWAESFDADVLGEAQNYVAPALAAQAVVQAGGNIDGVALDAGGGTGLSGVALSKVGVQTIDGMDLSPGMLKVARKAAVYRDLETAHLTEAVQKGTKCMMLYFVSEHALMGMWDPCRPWRSL